MTGRWPQQDLERQRTCPVCGGGERSLLYEGLTDRNLGCAPGTWDLHRCRTCGAAYLDPRPTVDAIGLAYRQYFTHEAPPAARMLGVSRLRRALANGYLNARYGTSLAPAWGIGQFVVPLFPLRRARTQLELRHLPHAGRRPSVLDVGCGNGRFLEDIARAGWEAVGVDPDPQAVECCRRRGLVAMHGRLETVALQPGSFDAVTFAHVLEHVHDPHDVLVRARELLRPGGVVWIATPNLLSAGHALFGRDWIALDPPRHLVVFTPDSLAGAAARAGFRIAGWPPPAPARPVLDESARLAGHRGGMRLRALLHDLAALLWRRTAEEIVLVASAE